MERAIRKRHRNRECIQRGIALHLMDLQCGINHRQRAGKTNQVCIHHQSHCRSLLRHPFTLKLVQRRISANVQRHVCLFRRFFTRGEDQHHATSVDGDAVCRHFSHSFFICTLVHQDVAILLHFPDAFIAAH